MPTAFARSGGRDDIPSRAARLLESGHPVHEPRAELEVRRGSAGRSAEVDEVKSGALRAVNDYFERRLTAVPAIRAYLDELAARP